MALGNQFINGRLYSWSSVEMVGGGVALPGIKSFNYKDNLDPGMPQGAGPLARGYTLGNYKADGSVEIYRDEWDDFILSIGGVGFMGIAIPFFVSYFEPLFGPKSDTVIGRIKSNDTSGSSDSTDGLTIKHDLAIIAPILWNGITGVPLF